MSNTISTTDSTSNTSKLDEKRANRQDISYDDIVFEPGPVASKTKSNGDDNK
jgi:hypothetical protein